MPYKPLQNWVDDEFIPYYDMEVFPMCHLIHGYFWGYFPSPFQLHVDIAAWKMPSPPISPVFFFYVNTMKTRDKTIRLINPAACFFCFPRRIPKVSDASASRQSSGKRLMPLRRLRRETCRFKGGNGEVVNELLCLTY